MNLDDKKICTILTALRTAADVYKTISQDPANHERIAEQFKRQEREALELADYIEEVRP